MNEDRAMVALRRLWRRLFPPDCLECGRSYPGGLLGSWWHAEGCPGAGPYTRQEGSDDE